MVLSYLIGQSGESADESHSNQLHRMDALNMLNKNQFPRMAALTTSANEDIEKLKPLYFLGEIENGPVMLESVLGNSQVKHKIAKYSSNPIVTMQDSLTMYVMVVFYLY